MRKKISQTQARKWKAQYESLQNVIDAQLRYWASGWPTGMVITSLDLSTLPATLSAIITARILNHAVVVTTDGNKVVFNACELPK